MKTELIPLAKNALILLELSAGMSAGDAAILKKIYRSDKTALIISNEEMKDIMKIVKLLEESGLLIKGISERIKTEAKEQKGGLITMLLGALAASILGNASSGRGVIRAGKGVIRAGQSF